MSAIWARYGFLALLSFSACAGGAAEPSASTPAAVEVPASSTRQSAAASDEPSAQTMGMAEAASAAPVAGAASAPTPRAPGGVAGASQPSAAGSGGSLGSTVAGAGGAPSLAAGSGGTAGASGAAAGGGGAGGLPMLGKDCEVDPLANESPFGSGFFQQFRGLMGCTAAVDLALYRKMLPEKFEMPADPQVCFYTLDFMISGVGPYHEAALLLPIAYAGMSGKYVLSMPLDNAAATSGGRAVGFPKYMTDVSLMQHGNDWSARAGNTTPDLEVEYTGECIAEDVFLWPDFINLTPIPAGETSSKAFLPPRDGRALMVPAEHLTDPKFYSLRGRVLMSIGDHLPWNGLIDETKPFTGYLTTFKGGIDLGNRPLD